MYQNNFCWILTKLKVRFSSSHFYISQLSYLYFLYFSPNPSPISPNSKNSLIQYYGNLNLQILCKLSLCFSFVFVLHSTLKWEFFNCSDRFSPLGDYILQKKMIYVAYLQILLNPHPHTHAYVFFYELNRICWFVQKTLHCIGSIWFGICVFWSRLMQRI